MLLVEIFGGKRKREAAEAEKAKLKADATKRIMNNRGKETMRQKLEREHQELVDRAAKLAGTDVKPAPKIDPNRKPKTRKELEAEYDGLVRGIGKVSKEMRDEANRPISGRGKPKSRPETRITK